MDENQGTPLDFLLAVMDCEDLELPVRMKAAITAAPYCHPKLEAIAIHNDAGDFGDRLTRARKRVATHHALLLEGKVTGVHNGEEIVLVSDGIDAKRRF